MNVLRMCGSTVPAPPSSRKAVRMRGSSVLSPPPSDALKYSFNHGSATRNEAAKNVKGGVGSPQYRKRKLKTNLTVLIPGKTSSRVKLKDVSMKSPTPGKNTPKGAQSPRSRKRCPINVGKLYELDDGRLGLCMYLGRTLFNKKGIWVGLQLENAEGKHNGTVHGRKYFLCRDGKGVFVRPNRIKRLVTEVSKSNINPKDKKVIKCPRRGRYIRKETIMNLVEITTPTYSKRGLKEQERRNSHRKHRVAERKSGWQPAQYDIKPDHGFLFKPKTLYTEKELHANDGAECDAKPKVSEIMEDGPESKWERAKFDVKSDLTDHGGLFYPRSKLHKHLNEKADHKPGAIETGKAENFEKPNYPGRAYSIEKEQYNLHYPKSKLHENDGEHADRKPGAIEIGKSDYKTAQYNTDTSIEKRQYALYHPISELRKRSGEKTPHKEWAAEIGRAEGFHGAAYSIDWNPIKISQYGLFYNPSDLKKSYEKVDKGSGRSSRRDSNTSSRASRESKHHAPYNMWNLSADTLEHRESKLSVSSRDVSFRSEGSPGPQSRGTPSYSREYTASCIVTSVADQKLKANEEQKRGLNLHELKDREEINLQQQEASDGTMEDEISAYLPARRYPSRKGSVSIKNSIRDDFSDGNGIDDVSSSGEKEDLSQEATDEEIFMEEILSLARVSMDKRRSRANSRSESRRSSFSRIHEQRRMSRTMSVESKPKYCEVNC